MHISAHTDVGGREHNEDSYAVERIGERWLLAVADGLGGMRLARSQVSLPSWNSQRA